MSKYHPIKERPSEARLQSLVAEVSQATGVPVEAIRSACRTGSVVAARWQVWRQLCEGDGFGLSPTAKAWGCDHSSIVHARDQAWVPRRHHIEGGEPYGSPSPITQGSAADGQEVQSQDS